jgi:hypothetical protein
MRFFGKQYKRDAIRHKKPNSTWRTSRSASRGSRRGATTPIPSDEIDVHGNTVFIGDVCFDGWHAVYVDFQRLSSIDVLTSSDLHSEKRKSAHINGWKDLFLTVGGVIMLSGKIDDKGRAALDGLNLEILREIVRFSYKASLM